ncbi:MAG: amidohydrolase [Lachnospiraceae bacterium]|nr:amidohydrolase [Lachnospiraceae bacterium]
MVNLIQKAMERHAEELNALSRDLWEHPQVAWQETYAAETLSAYLRKNGFEVEKPVGGIPTAFTARYGSGRPVIGILAEYDALPGFSQKTVTHEEPEVPGGAGHACGHNLMGAAHAGACVMLKEIMEQEKIPGTVVFFGCPAEEVLTGKVFMARAGVFDGIDCALNFHPDSCNGVNMHRLAGINNVKFKFHGIISHAAARPFDGRSASDAAELMNVGANYLREHIPDGVRIHYVTLDGGKAPNIVPNFAQTWYHVRAKNRPDVEKVYARLVKVAKGAAMMTETEVEVDLQGGCYPSVQNKVLAEAINEAMHELGGPKFTEEEKAYAAELDASCPAKPARLYSLPEGEHLDERIIGIYGEGTFAYNASDIGDVGHLVPATMFGTACYNMRADLHSWQVAACTGHAIGQRGMRYAAGILALASLKLFTEPERVARAKEEFDTMMDGETYLCPIPDEVRPPVAN